MPTSTTSPLMRIVEPSAESGRARMASHAAIKPVKAISNAYATHRPIFTPSWVHTTDWKPSCPYHIRSVMNRDRPKNSATMMTNASTTPMNILVPRLLPWLPEGLRGKRGPAGPRPEGLEPFLLGVSPSASTLRMIGSSSFELLRREPPPLPNSIEKGSLKDMIQA